MPATQDHVTITSGESGLRALLLRARGLDEQATVRFRQLGEQLDCFVTTPFRVLASRRVVGEVSRDGAAAGVSAVLEALDNSPDNASLGPARDAMFPGALPPASRFVLVDELPVGVVRDLADQGRALARQFSGPMGPPASLMDQTVITATSSSGDTSVEVPMRAVFACTALQLIPGASAPEEVPRQLRVSSLGRWLRIDAPFGSVYFSAGGFSLVDRLV